jgi:peroxiredoxin
LGIPKESSSRAIGIRRTEERSLSSSDLEDTVANPLMVLRQSSGNFFYLSDSAAVVLDRSGKVVTTYSSADFDENVRAIIKHIHERE